MSELTLKRCSSPLSHHAYREFLLHLSPCGDTKAPALRHLLEKWRDAHGRPGMPLAADSAARGRAAFANALPRLFLKIYYSVAT